MKKFVLFLITFLCTGAAFAEEFPYMAFTKLDGSVVSVKSEGLSISVNDDKLSAVNADGTVTIELAQLASMAFAKEGAGAVYLSADDTAVDVYTDAGVHVDTFFSADAARQALSAPGVYIFKSKNAQTKELITK